VGCVARMRGMTVGAQFCFGNMAGRDVSTAVYSNFKMGLVEVGHKGMDWT
jgi:hypothetical protein